MLEMMTKKSSVRSVGLKKTDWFNILPYITLIVLVISYAVFLSILSIDKHNRFVTTAFDLGIFDQSIWQFSRFSTPFNSVRGLHILGDHFALINALISPLYWFTDDVRALLVLQSIMLAAAAIPLFLIAKHYFNNKWISLVFCCSYLLFPALHYGNLEDYHPEAFAPFFLLFAFYFIINGKKWLYLIFFLLALTVREDVALTTFLMGIYIYFKYDKKLGVFTSIFSLIWAVCVIELFMPFFRGGSYLYVDRVLGEFGSRPSEILSKLLNPQFMFSKFFNQVNAKYMWELFSPVGFLSLLSPVVLIMSSSLWISLIAEWPYAHSIHYHYVIPIIPFVFLSLIIGIAKFKKRKIFVYSFLSILVICTLIGNYGISPYDSSMKNYELIIHKLKNFNVPSENDKQVYELFAMIPKNASISASHYFVPHLTHRSKIFMFSNPFKNAYYDDPKGEYYLLEKPDYIFVRNFDVKEAMSILQPWLQNNTYKSINKTKGSDELFVRVV